MKKGFYMYFNGKEYFCITSKKTKCDSVARAFLRVLHADDSPWNIQSVKYRMQAATLKTEPYIDIFGDNFGGRGDNNTIIFEG